MARPRSILCGIASGLLAMAVTSTGFGAGVTIITHGWQSGLESGWPPQTYWPILWVDNMALAIKARADANGCSASIWEYRASEQRFVRRTGPSPESAGSNGEMILLFDWSPDSNEFGGGFVEAAGEALFAALMKGWVKSDLSKASFVQLPLHFIGHSRGAVVNSAAVRRLGGLGIEVDQTTTLDPHPASGGNIYEDSATPIDAWANVAFADNYYRADANYELGIDFPMDLFPDFNGVPVPGAAPNRFPESSLDGLPGSDPGYREEHRDVHLWYHGTIDQSPSATDGQYEVPSSFYGGGNPVRAQSGFNYSRVARGARPVSGLRASGPYRRPIPVGETWVANGNFSYKPGINSQLAGYFIHGGLADLNIELDTSGGQGRFARLDSNEAVFRHNAVFIPPMGGNAELRFRMRANHDLLDDVTLVVTALAGSDSFQLGTRQIVAESDWVEISYLLSAHEGQSRIIEFRLDDAAPLLTTIDLDDIRIGGGSPSKWPNIATIKVNG